MTKEQEREILKKIAELINQAGPGSYLMAAFDGCLELAEDNINNDFVCSLTDRIEGLENERKKLIEDRKQLDAELKASRELAEHHKENAERWHQNFLESNKDLSAAYDQMSIQKDDYEDLLEQREALRENIIHLKARLFDLLEGSEA